MPTKHPSFLQSTLAVPEFQRNYTQGQGADNFETLPKTYRNKAGNAVNWPKVLKRVAAIGQKKVRTDDDLKFVETATELSNHWVTCACGNTCSIIPRDTDGEPRDHTLSVLGLNFFNNVEAAAKAINNKRSCYREIRSAVCTLNKIEKASAVLVKDILSQKK